MNQTGVTLVGEMTAPVVWLLLGKKAGDNNQILALAEQLGWPFEIKHIVNRPWELITNLALKVTLAGIDQQASSPLTPPWPDLVISAGRRNEPVARWIRQQASGHVRLVHIGRPWSSLNIWSLIITTPQYFLPAAANILHNPLPLHGITRAHLDSQRATVREDWVGLPQPYTVVLLGGDSGQFVFTPDKGHRMGCLVNQMVEARGGSVLVTDSRRTPPDASEAFWEQIKVPAFRHSWRTPEKENPYLAFLAMADCLVVTGESMSMLAEASATGKPLYLFDLSDQQGPWWRYRHNYRYKPLSHRLAMAWGPQRIRRDIGRIQQALVTGGKALWLEDWLESENWLAGWIDLPPEDMTLETTVRRVKALFGQ